MLKEFLGETDVESTRYKVSRISIDTTSIRSVDDIQQVTVHDRVEDILETVKDAHSSQNFTEAFGRLSLLSTYGALANLDWALVHLENCKEIENLWRTTGAKFPNQLHIASPSNHRSSDAKVFLITGSSGFLTGTLSANSTFMRTPLSTAFQEMHKVRLDGKLRE